MIARRALIGVLAAGGLLLPLPGGAAFAQSRRAAPVTITACHQIAIGDRANAQPIKAIFERAKANINKIAGSQVVAMEWTKCSGISAAEFYPVDGTSGTYLVTGNRNWLVKLNHGGAISCAVAAPDYAVALSTVYYLATNPRTMKLAREIARKFRSQYPSVRCDGNSRVEVLWDAFSRKVMAR